MLDRVKNRELLFSVLALWTFAVAKPLLDVLEPTPEYWVANRIEGWTIVLIVLTLSVAIPVVLSTVLLVGKRIGRRGIIGASLFGVVFVVLAAIGIYHSLSFVLGKPVALAAGSIAAAFLALWVYHRFEAVRNFFFDLGRSVPNRACVVFVFGADTTVARRFKGRRRGSGKRGGVDSSSNNSRVR